MADAPIRPNPVARHPEEVDEGELSAAGDIPEDVLDDWRWILEQREAGGFDRQYAGKHIAVLNRKIIGASFDPELLVEYLVLRDKIDPKRVVIEYVDRW